MFYKTSSLNRLKSVSDRQRKALLVFTDVLILFFASYLSFVLRFDQIVPIEYFQKYYIGITLTISLKVVLFICFGLYRPLLRHSGLEMLEIILKVIIFSDGFIIFTSIIFAPNLIPRSVQIIMAIIGLVLIINSRLVIRSVIWRTNDIKLSSRRINSQISNFRKIDNHLKKILIYGAGITGYQVAQAIAIDNSAQIIGFIDDNKKLRGRRLLHHKIYESEDIQKLIKRENIQEVLLAIPSASAKRKSDIIQNLQKYSIHIKTVPSAQEIVSGKVNVTQFREIEISDLLGREEVPPNPQLLSLNISNKVVLVTGAGGSIGSELCRQIAQLKPKQLLLLDSSEFALYRIDLELREKFPQLKINSILGNIANRDFMNELFNSLETVETIYHAAAYKHVPMVESNPSQGVLNNTFGTLITAQTARKYGVQTFVLISTDKAVRPTNVMGASKRAAELVLQAIALKTHQQHSTCFTMVRFGNVLGSSGSVVPRFRQQITEGKAITLTHRDITRYFMTIPEAARLVIQAGAMGRGGDVFLLDMGEPVKIYDLAVQIIKLSGLQVGRDIDIKITGLRPGEKLYEELLISGNNIKETEHPKIFSAQEHMINWEELEVLLSELYESAVENNEDAVKKNLKRIVREYQISEDKSLVSSSK